MTISPISPISGLQDIPRYNSIVLDACNALWRNKALTETSSSPTDASGPSFSLQPGASCLCLPRTTIETLAAALFEPPATAVPYAETALPPPAAAGTGTGSSADASAPRKVKSLDPTRALRRTLSLTWGASWQAHILAFLRDSSATSLRSSKAIDGASDGCGLRASLALEETSAKIAYLEFLRSQGLVGLYEFLYAFISSLAKKRDASRAGRA
jgi:hypothetical protein